MKALALLISIISAEVIDLTEKDETELLAGAELFIVNFHAQWCRFSKQLEPILIKVDEAVQKAYPNNAVRIGRVNCEEQQKLTQKYRISKYPTIKVFRHGVEMRSEYRGTRTAGDFMAYINELMKDPVVKYASLEEANQRIESRTRGILTGYFEREDSTAYSTFSKVAKALQEECQFIAGFGAASEKERITGENILFRDVADGVAPISEAVFVGALTNYELMYAWAHDKCIPLVREITFTNGEELTEEGLPFLILFHKRDDTQSLQYYQHEISRSLVGEKSSINFLHADCIQFSHPLQHLGKSAKDCPVIAIDSFKHMYLFPDFSLIHQEGRLLQFVRDLHSGKLHREFHNGPDETNQAAADLEATTAEPALETDSVFKRLKPSKHRYSVHEEL